MPKRESQLTARECKALRMALIFGKPDEPVPVLESAIAKLIEQEHAQESAHEGKLADT